VKAIGQTILIALFVTFIVMPSLRPSVRSAVDRQVNSAQSTRDAARPKNLSQEEAELNRGLPTMLDSQTMLTKVELSATRNTYHLTMINMPTAYIDQEFLVKAQDLVGRRNCADSDVRWFLNAGSVMNYVIHGKDGAHAGSFMISKVYCERFG